MLFDSKDLTQLQLEQYSQQFAKADCSRSCPYYVTQQSNLPSEVSALKRQVCTLRRLLQTGFKKVFGIAAGVLLLKLRTRNRTVSSFTEGFLFSKVARMSSCIAEKVV